MFPRRIAEHVEGHNWFAVAIDGLAAFDTARGRGEELDPARDVDGS